jgi:hypothetical protein
VNSGLFLGGRSGGLGSELALGKRDQQGKDVLDAKDGPGPVPPSSALCMWTLGFSAVVRKVQVGPLWCECWVTSPLLTPWFLSLS